MSDSNSEGADKSRGVASSAAYVAQEVPVPAPVEQALTGLEGATAALAIDKDSSSRDSALP